MFRVLFLLFIIVPIIEITVLMQVGEILGVWPTIAIVVVSAWLGAKYVKQQGLATLQSVQTKMSQGEMPSEEIVAGLMLLIAGVLLVTPGFVTDIFGLSLLIPSVRLAIAIYIQKHIQLNQFSANSSFQQGSQEGFQQGNVYNNEYTQSTENRPISHHQGETLEGEFERKE